MIISAGFDPLPVFVQEPVSVRVPVPGKRKPMETATSSAVDSDKAAVAVDNDQRRSEATAASNSKA